MDWDAFFERTKVAAGVESYSKLAPLLGITDGAIGHYRQGRRVPQVWVVAEALKIQRHPTPEKAAIEIMRAAALTSSERTFWKRLLATTALMLIVAFPALPSYAATHEITSSGAVESVHYAKWRMKWNSAIPAAIRRLLRRLARWTAPLQGRRNACLLPL